MGRRKKNKPSGTTLDAGAVLRLFRNAGKPLTLDEIVKGLKLSKADKGGLRGILDQLADQGRIINTRKAWGLLDKMSLVTGRLQVVRSGNGFVIPEDSRRKDVFVDQRDLGDAWHGDRVVAAVSREMHRGNHQGRIVRVLERARQVLPAKVVRPAGAGAFLCRPTDPRLGFGIVVQKSAPGLDLVPGDVVLVAPGERLEPYLWEGTVIQRLGPEESLPVQEAVVKVNHQVPTSFPEDAVEQARALPGAPTKADMAGRKNLRGLGLVTIDGADARDFDDAVHVERTKRGWRLTVAIADVSHYVRPGSPLDREARERGNSYYFPLSVEPMFPEALSNGLCSLNPGVDRLCMVTAINIDHKGAPHEAEFFPAVMKSAARLTYAQVKRAVIDQEPGEAAKLPPGVGPMLEEAVRLAQALKKRRRQRGSLDFELPEAEVKADDKGRVIDVRPAVRTFAHKLIEECMIAANEAVARFLEGSPAGCLFRVHPDPDEAKLETLFEILARSGVAFTPPSEPDPAVLQGLLDTVRGTRMEYLVNRLLLRSMKQARYAPENEGHFGLASEAYCHFTSPIRRYADLMVHRQLKHTLGDAAQPVLGGKKLLDLCGTINACERKSVEAEREMDKRAAILLLLDKQGETFTGVVNGLSDAGFWVELAEVMAEGMVRLSTLDDDYYSYWANEERLVGVRTGRTFLMGQEVTVRLESVSLDRLEVDLSLVEGGRTGGEDDRGQGPRPRKRIGKSSGKTGRKPNQKPSRKSRGRGSR